MRTIEEFKHDREQWNRESANKQGTRLIIQWVVGLIVLAAAAIGGLSYYKAYQAEHQGEKTSVTGNQVPGK